MTQTKKAHKYVLEIFGNSLGNFKYVTYACAVGAPKIRGPWATIYFAHWIKWH